MKTVVERLKPGEEIFSSIEALCLEHKIEAGTILSLVGSVTTISLRYADQSEASQRNGPLEIVSVTGTVAKSGCHIHLAVSDEAGTTYGGHLLQGAKVYTTVELIILDLSDTCTFSRSLCPLSGFEELVIEKKN